MADKFFREKEEKRKNIASFQRYLDIGEIKEGVIVLKDQNLRAVLMVSSINFALKSQEEQDAIIYHFQNFLNSLDFSIQIVISSRRLNIEDYYKTLMIREKEQSNELLKVQIGEYRNFIKELIEMSNIVNKTFYIVVPYSPSEELAQVGKSFLSGLTQKGGAKKSASSFRSEDFLKNRNQLMQRVQHIASGLSGVGVKMTTLNTQELIELFYTIYNPEISEHGGLTAIEQLDIAM
ncbi:hypothetical protein KKE99_02055 [Patescibacteria group bacterium]|nr:hypothetical protein [Patescibacteria group bacterium]